MGVEVQIDTRKLNQLMRDLSPGQISALLRRAGFEAEGRAKAGAPVDTGFLRSSIGTQVESATAVVVGAKAKYAAFVEQGTRRMKAQPYLRPAVELAVSNLIAALTHMFRRAGR